jgi:hypothetical protein
MGRGLNPKKWGQNAWSVFHVMSKIYDEMDLNERNQYRNAIETFFKIFMMLIMCESCRKDSLKIFEHLEKTQYSLKRSIVKKTLFKRSIEFHNQVNEKIGKKQMKDDVAEIIWKNELHNSFNHLWEFILRVAMHYDNNGNNVKQYHYQTFIDILPELIAITKFNVTDELKKNIELVSELWCEKIISQKKFSTKKLMRWLSTMSKELALFIKECEMSNHVLKILKQINDINSVDELSESYQILKSID